jgi:hypothetical protein
MISPRRTHIVLVTILVSLVGPVHARAQSGLKDNLVEIARKVGVHGNVSVRHPIDEDVTKGLSLGGSIGLAPGRTGGWKYPVSLVLFSENLHSPNGEEFAFVRHVGLLGGVGYGWHFGRLATGAQFQIGFALTREKTQGDVPAAFGVPASAVGVRADNAFLWRPQFKTEYLINQKFTIRAGVDYVHSHPEIVVTTPSGQLTGWDLSNIHANVGIGFYPFRK